ncbi:MAG: flavin reductase family protein [Dehalococcoidia bacterium]
MSDASVLSDDFRSALSRFASGVTVVTARSGDGTDVGFTASAFSSLSLDPPLVLVCLDRSAESFPVFEQAPSFAISILGADQEEAAVRFATRGADKFGGSVLEAGDATGLPLVAGAIAHLECAMHDQLEGGDHVILVGRVVRAASNGDRPLLYFNRAFGEFDAGGDGRPG